MLSTLRTPLLDEANLSDGRVNSEVLPLPLCEGGENKEHRLTYGKRTCFSKLLSSDFEKADFNKMAMQLFKLHDPTDSFALQDIYI